MILLKANEERTRQNVRVCVWGGGGGAEKGEYKKEGRDVRENERERWKI